MVVSHSSVLPKRGSSERHPVTNEKICQGIDGELSPYYPGRDAELVVMVTLTGR
jgi:hypothetical protein